jgi:hypothetical protein
MVGVDGPTTASLAAAGQPVPSPQLIRALIDTGTDATGIDAQVLSRLHLTPFQQSSTQTLAGRLRVSLFQVSLSIPQTARAAPPLSVLDQLIVMALPSPPPGIDALLGLDVLDRLLLIFDGPNGELIVAD